MSDKRPPFRKTLSLLQTEDLAGIDGNTGESGWSKNISLHLKNIYKEKELDENATSEEFSVVQKEGNREVTRTLTCYSLEAIVAVGYRVNSERGTQFRQWAIPILQQYIHKGFAIDSDRFKYGSRFSTRFFDDLLEEIRDIRASERMAYQKITDIYATSIDYKTGFRSRNKGKASLHFGNFSCRRLTRMTSRIRLTGF